MNFETRKQMEAVMRAAKLERRSISSYIVNTVVPIAKEKITKQRETETETALAS